MSEIKNVILCGVFYYIIQKMRRFGQSLSKFFYNPDIQTVIKIQNREAHRITNETRTSIKKFMGCFGICWRYMKGLKCIISFRKMKRKQNLIFGILWGTNCWLFGKSP